MIKAIIFSISLAASTIASAAILDKEVPTSNGTKKVCIYSDGSSTTVSSASLCPMTK